MHSKFWTSTIGKTIRWVIFLPSAVISAILVGAIAFLINSAQSYITGDSSLWAYVGAAVFSMLTLLYVSWYIIPNLKKAVLYSLFGMRLIASIIWFIEPSSSPLNLIMLIIQELAVLGAGLFLIRKLLSDE
ncbi:MAG: hypothetical protein ACOCWM_00480 [Cyclobacteriaceae bacterium]